MKARKAFRRMGLLFGILMAYGGAFGDPPSHEVNFPSPGRPLPKIFLPSQYQTRGNWPVIVLLHPFGAGEPVPMLAYLHLLSRLPNFIALGPYGTKNSGGSRFWNADYCCDFEHSGVDDAGYLSALIEHVLANYKADPKRIYLVGNSNGGFMVNRMICERPDLFAGAVAIAGGAAKNPADCRVTRALPYLQIHAEDDPVVPYSGEHPQVATADEAMRRRLKANQCAEVPAQTLPLDLVSNIPGPDSKVEIWNHCRGGGTIQRVTVLKHEAPDHNAHGPRYSPLIGEIILNFLMNTAPAQSNMTLRNAHGISAPPGL